VQITFNLPHVFSPGSTPESNAPVVEALLEALVKIDVAYLREHPETPSLASSGVRYDRTTLWEPIPALYARGYGDCKSLTAARVAEYRLSGRPARPVFRWFRRADGNMDFHILIMTTAGGRVVNEDPSKELGMGADERRWFAGGGGSPGWENAAHLAGWPGRRR
jgi:hypothetical protein